MLPEPDKVARAIKKIFRSGEERRQEKEQEREMQVRMGLNRVRRHINSQQQMVEKLTGLAKRSLSLNDEGRFRQLGRQLIWTRADIVRWEKYLLSLEMLEARRDQLRSSVELISTVKAMTESMGELAGAQEIGHLQADLEKGLARAETVEERMSMMMEMMDATLESGMPADEKALEALQSSLGQQVSSEENAAYDKEIEEGLRKIRQELGSAEQK